MSLQRTQQDLLLWWTRAEQSPDIIRHAERMMDFFAEPFRETFLPSPFDAPSFTERAGRFCAYLRTASLDVLERVADAPYPEDRDLPHGCEWLLRCAKLAAYRATSERTAARQVIAISSLFLLGMTDPGVGLLLVLSGDTDFAWVVAHYARRYIGRWLREENLPRHVEPNDVFSAAHEFACADVTPLGAIRTSVLENYSRTTEEVPESRLPLYEDAPSPLELAPSSEPDPAEVVVDRDTVERILARFGQRTADLLRLMLEGRTAAEAARELGISEGTARKLLERARKQFSRNP